MSITIPDACGASSHILCTTLNKLSSTGPRSISLVCTCRCRARQSAGAAFAARTSSLTRVARIGTTFDYILLTADSRTAGANSNAIDINNFRINGTNLGNFTADSSSPNIGQWFEPASPGPRFRSIEILGDMVYRNTGGNGAFQGERPRMQLQFFGPEPVPEPASWVMLVAGFGAVGAALRRRRTVAAA